MNYEELINLLKKETVTENEKDLIKHVDYYTLFDLNRTLTINTEWKKRLNESYKKLVLLTHPDKNHKNKEEIFKFIQHAKDTLLDPEKRKTYDETLPSVSLPRSNHAAFFNYSHVSQEFSPREEGSTSPFNDAVHIESILRKSSKENPLQQPSQNEREEQSAQPNFEEFRHVMKYFSITGGTDEEKEKHIHQLVKQYLKKSNRGTVFFNQRMSNEEETVIFNYVRFSTVKIGILSNEITVKICFSDKEILGPDMDFFGMDERYLEKHPDCRIILKTTSPSCCCACM